MLGCFRDCLCGVCDNLRIIAPTTVSKFDRSSRNQLSAWITRIAGRPAQKAVFAEMRLKSNRWITAFVACGSPAFALMSMVRG